MSERRELLRELRSAREKLAHALDICERDEEDPYLREARLETDWAAWALREQPKATA